MNDGWRIRYWAEDHLSGRIWDVNDYNDASEAVLYDIAISGVTAGTLIGVNAGLKITMRGARGTAGGFVAKLNKPNKARRIYHVTDDFERVVVSGRSWGQTEGSVYGMRIPNASRARTMIDLPINDPGVVIFEGEAAFLFKPHPIEGPFSIVKRMLGQYKSGFGDIVFDMSTATRKGNCLVVRNANIGSHAGQSTSKAMMRLWGRRMIDIGLGISIPSACAASVYYIAKGK